MKSHGEMIVNVTPTEKRVTELVEQGLTNKQVAAELSTSEGAVKQHLFRIYKKCGVDNRIELVRRDGRSEPLIKRILS